MSAVTPDNVSVIALLMVIGSLGCKLSARDGQLFVSNRSALPDPVRAAIIRHREALLSIAGGTA